MKKKRILFAATLVLVFLSAALSAFAQENRTIEESGEYFSGDSFEFNDELYVVYVNSYEEVILSYGDEFMVVRNGSCTIKDAYHQFCVETIEYDPEENDMIASLEVYSSAPEVEVTRSIDEDEFVIGKTATITVTITNTGQRKAHNVTYIDSYPEAINLSVPLKYRADVRIIKDRKITLANGSIIRRDTAFWQDDIETGESLTFKYKLTALKPVDDDFRANVLYFDGYEKANLKSEIISINAESFVELRLNLVDADFKNTPGSTDVTSWESKSPAYSGEQMLLLADVVNTYEDNRSTSIDELRFYLPEGVRYIGPTSLRIYPNSSDRDSSYISVSPVFSRINDFFHTWSGMTTPRGKLFVMKLEAADEGEYVIRVSGDFRKEGLPVIHDQSEILEFDVENEVIDIGMVPKDGEIFNSGQTAYFSIYLVNPNELLNFTDLNVSVDSHWTGKKMYGFDRLNASKYLDLFNKYIKMPYVNSETEYTVEVNVSYSTQYGEVIKEEFDRRIIVKPVSHIRILHELDNELIQGEGSAEVDHKENEITLQLENTLEKEMESIQIYEVIGQELNPADSIKKKIISLPAAETSDILRYSINPPDRSEWTNYTITSQMIYAYENETYNITSDINIRVKPKEMDIDIIKEIDEEDIAKGQIVNVDYKITNTEDEPIEDIRIVFPKQYGTDLVGFEEYNIDRMEPEEIFTINNHEMVRFKTQGNVKLDRADVYFRDSLGNLFNDTSTSVTNEVEPGSLETPAIFLNLTAPLNATRDQIFRTELAVFNKGNEGTYVTLNLPDGEKRLYSGPGSENIITINQSINMTGLVILPKITAEYSVDGMQYHTASEQADTYIREKREKKEVIIEEVPEPVAEEKERRFNIKYLYLLAFIIVISLIILYIIKRPKKEEGLEFLER
ncbi:DUF11 domain-containing protein [Candidatus Woesearchaeota archaeon]|nr:DUF11 domain-containing protein [Candidatus Woesearchaeota archaeon]